MANSKISKRQTKQASVQRSLFDYCDDGEPSVDEVSPVPSKVEEVSEAKAIKKRRKIENRRPVDGITISVGTVSQCDTPVPAGIHLPQYAWDENEGRVFKNALRGGITDKIPLCNFNSKIVEKICIDDGTETKNYYVIETIKNNVSYTITIPEYLFQSMKWISQLGPDAVVEPCINVAYIRHYIQLNSRNIREVKVFSHTGWRVINGKSTFLTAGGGVGSENTIRVNLPREISRYNLPTKAENEIDAINASLSFLTIGNPAITYPLWAYLMLSAMTSLLIPPPNFSMMLLGATGSYKTTVATLLLSHSGNFVNVEMLQNFEDTANILEYWAYLLKDVIMLVDDLHPSITQGKSDEMELTAHRLIRSFSNRTARGRLTDKRRREPRGLLLITSELDPKIQSTQARLMVIDISKDDIDTDKLKVLQANAHLLPHATSSYILWLSEHMKEIQDTFRTQFGIIRDQYHEKGQHLKTAEQLSFLQFALTIALTWIVERGLLSDSEAVRIKDEAFGIFKELAQKQACRIQREDPVKLFAGLLEMLITQEKVRLNHKSLTDDYIGGGEIIGWFDDVYFYLLPEVMWATVQKYHLGQFPATKNMFYSMLSSKGIIATRDGNTFVERIGGKTIRVIKIIRAFFNNI
ncbi:MAG: DUF927 domain-containing protein [Nitrospirae bacterium]|nr:DUF927 domain-containing protein [Nitrospirota bacterium]